MRHWKIKILFTIIYNQLCIIALSVSDNCVTKIIACTLHQLMLMECLSVIIVLRVEDFLFEKSFWVTVLYGE